MQPQRRTKILIVTDSAALPSGHAETTRLIFTELLARFPHDYEIHQIGLYHCYAVTEPEWPIYATSLSKGPDGRPRFDPADEYAQRTFPTVAARLKPDIVFAFGDPQRVLHLCKPRAKRNHLLVLYLNFDGLPMPHAWGATLNEADLVITKSEFSKLVLLRFLPAVTAGKVRNLYSPADLQRFAPLSVAEKMQLREELFPAGIPRDSFVLGWVGRNQWRKQVWLMYKAIHHLRAGDYLVCRKCQGVSLRDWEPSMADPRFEVPLASESRPGWQGDRCAHCGDSEPDAAEPLGDIVLWMHMAEEPAEDWPVANLERQFALTRGRDIIYTPGHEMKAALSPLDIPALYQLWDCLLYLSGGEGFGLPAWEAMCAGLPAVYTNYSGHAEFLRKADAGIPVSGILQPERATCIWRMVADIAQVIEAVRRLYFDRNLAATLGANGRAFVQDYSPQRMADRWHSIFQNLLKNVERQELPHA